MARKPKPIQAIAEVSRAFGTTSDRDRLLEIITRSAVETMRGKAACLFLLDEKEDVYVVAAQTGLSEGYLHAGSQRARAFYAQLMEKGHLHFPDASSDPRLENREAKKGEGIASILVVPVRVAGNPIGVLTLYTSEPREFSKDEIEFLTILAEQGGMAIEHARLVERIRERTRLFYDLASGMASSHELAKILETLTKDLSKALDVKAASIRLLGDDGTTLHLAASHGLSDEYLRKGPVSAEKSIAETLKGKPVVVKDASLDPGVQYREEKLREGIVSILSVPIMSKEAVIGVLRLYSDRAREFTEEEIQFANALALFGGIAIGNVKLYASLESDIRDLRENYWIFKTWY
jgi:GAF domain-containing protein